MLTRTTSSTFANIRVVFQTHNGSSPYQSYIFNKNYVDCYYPDTFDKYFEIYYAHRSIDEWMAVLIYDTIRQDLDDYRESHSGKLIW